MRRFTSKKTGTYNLSLGGVAAAAAWWAWRTARRCGGSRPGSARSCTPRGGGSGHTPHSCTAAAAAAWRIAVAAVVVAAGRSRSRRCRPAG